MSRYSRHHSLHNFGKQNQDLLKTKSALIIGCGGLGCNAALNLTGSGVGTVGLMDKDTVCISNLHRQHGHSTNTLGLLKVDSLTISCREINPEIKINRYPLWFDTSETVKNIIKKYDVILDCTDTATTRVNINRMCKSLNKPFIFASAIGWDGQLLVVNPQGPCLECVFPAIKDIQDTCENTGVCGPVPGIMGSMQALEAIKMLINANIDYGLTLYDSYNTIFTKIATEKDPNCLVCGNNDFIQNISHVKEYSEFLKDTDQKVLLDIRNEHNEDQDVLGSVKIKSQEINSIISKLSNMSVYIVCEIGERSKEIVKELRIKGYSKSWSIAGGMRKIFS